MEVYIFVSGSTVMFTFRNVLLKFTGLKEFCSSAERKTLLVTIKSCSPHSTVKKITLLNYFLFVG